MSKKTTKNTAAKPDDPQIPYCVYIGPSIRGVITEGEVFSMSKKDALQFLYSAVERYPSIERLLVTGAELPEARIQVKTPGNMRYNNYIQLASGQY